MGGRERNLIVFFALVALACAAHAQQSEIKSWSSYEDYCRDNPKAPTCINGKPITMDDVQRNGLRVDHNMAKPIDTIVTPHRAEAPSPRPVPVQPALSLKPDWAFAHPGAEVLLGINVAALRRSPTVRQVLDQLSRPMHIERADLERFLAQGDGVDQLWMSMRSGDSLVLLQGSVNLPQAFVQLANGMTSYRISSSAVVVGHEASVMKAVERLMHPSAAPSAAVLRMKALAAGSDLWGTGTRASLPPGQTSPLEQELTGYSLAVDLNDGVSFRLRFHYPSTQAAERAFTLLRQDPNVPPPPVNVSSEVIGSSLQIGLRVSRTDLADALDHALAGPFGKGLENLANTIRSSNKIVVYGQPGGPKQVQGAGPTLISPANVPRNDIVVVGAPAPAPH